MSVNLMNKIVVIFVCFLAHLAKYHELHRWSNG